MKIILDYDYKYKVIEFCCGELGKLVMNNFVEAYAHSDHFPKFFITIKDGLDDMSLNYCPFCGEKVTGEFIKEEEI